MSVGVKLMSLAGLGILLSAASTSHAAIISQTLSNSGWTVSWEANPNVIVDFAVDFVKGDRMVVTEKFVNFGDARPDPVIVTFSPTRAIPVRYIYINDETIVNNTSEIWDGFSMKLTGMDNQTQSSPAIFASNSSNNFGTTPFTSAIFSADRKTVDFSGGSLNNHGGLWLPGLGSSQLVIDSLGINNNVPSSAVLPTQSFKLMEMPVAAPEPASLALLAMGGLMLMRRRQA